MVVLQNFRHLLRYDKRRFMVELGGGESAVALELAQIQPVGGGNGSKTWVIARDFKSLRNNFAQRLGNGLQKKRPFLL